MKWVGVKVGLVWHIYGNEDESCYMIKGALKICFNALVKTIKVGEMFVVAKRAMLKPFAMNACWLVLFEPSVIKHAGVGHIGQTVSGFKWVS